MPARLKNINGKLSYSKLAFTQVDYKRKAIIAWARGLGDITRVPYLPWVSIRFNSSGFCSRHLDPVTGEILHSLSSGESDWIRSLLWLSGHAGMYSQVRIPRQDTLRIAKKNGYRHPKYPDGVTPYVLTTDLVQIRWVNGRRIMTAFSVKSRPSLTERAGEKLLIEKEYWEEQGVVWQLLFRTQINTARIENIRWIENYVPSSPLVPARNEWQRIEAVLFPLVSSGMPLNAACHRADEILSFDGVGLAQVRFYLAARIWVIDFDEPINTFRPLQIIHRDLKAL